MCGTIITKRNIRDVELPNVNSLDPLIDHDEIYRELNLRGYNYRGLFKGIVNTDITGSVGAIKWEDNWVTFIDKLLQIKIPQIDARLLLIPVGIKRIEIDTFKHYNIIKNFAENEPINLPAYANQDGNIIK